MLDYWKLNHFMTQRTLTSVFVGIVALLVIAVLYVWRTEDNWVPADETDTWDVSSSTIATFRYPDDLDTDYVVPVDWPPRVQVADAEYVCLEAGAESEPAGRTEERKIFGDPFCITLISEGAVGSIYTQYVYTFTKDEKLVSLLFSAREPQCLNYDGSRRERCIEEQGKFDMDSFVARIIKTLEIR